MSAKKYFFVLAAMMFAGMFLAPDAHAAGVKMTFYGNQHFRFVSPKGTVVLINPWIKGNKDAGIGMDFYKKGEVDLILVTSGHGDDQGNAVEIAANTGATIFVAAELGKWMQDEIIKYGGSKKQIYRGAISGRYKVGDVTAMMMLSQHGSGYNLPKGMSGMGYGGPATGFLMTFEGGPRIYMAGSTGLTMDLQLYGMRYKPDIAMLPVMGAVHDAPGRRGLRRQAADDRQSQSQDRDSAAYPHQGRGPVDGNTGPVRGGSQETGAAAQGGGAGAG